MNSAYNFNFVAIDKKTLLPLKEFAGKVILVVNTASQCGFTKQYKDLESLYQTYREQGLVVIGVPSNDFGRQEPADNEEIQKFCEINFGISFYLTKKETVSGKNAHPFYLWARKTLGFGSAPKWNFHKYLINRQGELVNYFYSFTNPQSKKIIKAIEALL